MPLVGVFGRILSKRKTLEMQRGMQGGDGWDLGALRSIVALVSPQFSVFTLPAVRPRGRPLFQPT